jgi:hypothetical protein
LEEIPAIAGVFIPSIVATKGIKVDLKIMLPSSTMPSCHWFFGHCLRLSLLRRALGALVLLWRWPPHLVGVVASRSRSRSKRMVQLRSCLRALWASCKRTLSLMTTL